MPAGGGLDVRQAGVAAPTVGADNALLGDTAAPARRSRRRRLAVSLGSYVGMVFVLLTLNFLIPRAMPGDPIQGLVGQASANFTFGDQTKVALEKYYGLRGSLPSQYVHYLSRLAHGDLGRTITTNAKVATELRRRAGWTVLLLGTSTVVATGLGTVAGIHSGWRRDRPMDRGLMTVLLVVQEFPAFLLGALILYLFAVKLGWFPLAHGQADFSGSFSLFRKVVDMADHLVLPLVVLTAAIAADSYLVMRSSMVSELGSDYLRLGRAKGLRDRRLKYRHAARNALLPLVALTAVDVGFAVTANIVVERIFSYPGLGGLLFDSIAKRDYPAIQGVFLVLSVGIVTVNAVADALYRKLDPRTA
ncbi:MAG: ABC transporter permease [Acidimicrobiales bacterium]